MCKRGRGYKENRSSTLAAFWTVGLRKEDKSFERERRGGWFALKFGHFHDDASCLTKWLNWHHFCFYFFACFLSCNTKTLSLWHDVPAQMLLLESSTGRAWRDITPPRQRLGMGLLGDSKFQLWWFAWPLTSYQMSPKVWTNLGRFQVEWLLQWKFHGNFCLKFQQSFINFGKTSKFFNLHTPFNHLKSCLPCIWNAQSYCQLSEKKKKKEAWYGFIFVLKKTGWLIMNLFWCLWTVSLLIHAHFSSQPRPAGGFMEC